MTPLFALWSLSLLVVLAIITFARSRVCHSEVSIGGFAIPTTFSEFFGDQLHDIFVFASKTLHLVKPHAKQVGVMMFTLSKRGHDLFVERVFGRTEQKRGNTVSFFLKHIAEERRGGEREHRDPLSLH